MPNYLKPILLDTLKIANISTEGPTKTATGGMAADTLLKYGKKFSVEMQDALGHARTLQELYGADFSSNKQILAITDRFPGEKTLVGTTFVIDQATGVKQPIKICIPIFNCDGIFNLTQDAEGDVSTFDLNGQVVSFKKDSSGPVVNGKYTAGTDNFFYFMATADGMDAIKDQGYRAVWEDDTTYYDEDTEKMKVKSSTGGVTQYYASLEAMMAKFGVVTVMDVEIYPTIRFKESVKKGSLITYKGKDSAGNAKEIQVIAKADHSIGDWDAVGTFLFYKQQDRAAGVYFNDGKFVKWENIVNEKLAKDYGYNVIDEDTKEIIPSITDTITANLFSGCETILQVVIPKEITGIGSNAFANSSIKSIIYKGTEKEWKEVECKEGWNSGITATVEFEG